MGHCHSVDLRVRVDELSAPWIINGPITRSAFDT
jgi:hypothetical protein